MISTKKKTISRIRRNTILEERESAMVCGTGEEDGVVTFGGRWLMSNCGCWGLLCELIDYRGSLGIPERPLFAADT